MFELDRHFFLRGIFLAALGVCLFAVGGQVRFDPVRREPVAAEVVVRPPARATHPAGRAAARSIGHGRQAVLNARHGAFALP